MNGRKRVERKKPRKGSRGLLMISASTRATTMATGVNSTA